MTKFILALFVAFPLLVQSSASAADYDQFVLRVKTTEAGTPDLSGWGSAVAADLVEFGLKGDQYLLSAAHVVHGSTRIEIEVAGKWHEARVVFQDDDYDLCVLKIERRLNCLPLGKSVPQNLMGIGFKWGFAPAAINEGVCTAKSTNGNKAQWRAALSIAPGCSGGPVLSLDGKIAGIVIAGASDGKGNMRDDTTIFVPCTILRQWLEGCRK